MKTYQLARLYGAFLVFIIAWPCIHRVLVVTHDVNPWQLYGFAMYCTPHMVQVHVGKVDGDDLRTIPSERLPREQQVALRKFVLTRNTVGKLHSHKAFASSLRKVLPPSEPLSMIVDVTRLDPSSSRLKTDREIYPIR